MSIHYQLCSPQKINHLHAHILLHFVNNAWLIVANCVLFLRHLILPALMHAVFTFKPFESIWLCKILSIKKTFATTWQSEHYYVIDCMIVCDKMLEPKYLSFARGTMAHSSPLSSIVCFSQYLSLGATAECWWLPWLSKPAGYRDTKTQKWDVSWSSGIVLSDIRVLNHNHKQSITWCLLLLNLITSQWTIYRIVVSIRKSGLRTGNDSHDNTLKNCYGKKTLMPVTRQTLEKVIMGNK